VEVRLDPRVQLPQSDLEQQLKFALLIGDDISRLSGIVNRLRSIGKQLADRNQLLKDNPKAATLIKQAQELVAKLDALEAKLHNPKAEVAYDILAQKGGAQLYSKLIFLFEFIKDADGPPTQGMREEYAEQAKELRQHEAEFTKLLATELARLNEAAKKLDIPGVLVPPK